MRQTLIWKVTSLFLFGIIVGMIALRVWSSDSSATKTEPSNTDDLVADQRIVIPGGDNATPVDFTPPDSAREASLARSRDLLRSGDRFLTGGNYSMALDQYLDVSADASQFDSSLLLRMGLCYEHAGEFVTAERAYRSVIATAKNLNHRMLAGIGTSRVRIQRNQVNAALESVADFVLLIDQSGAIPNETRAQLAYQWGKSLEAISFDYSKNSSQTGTRQNHPAHTDLIDPNSIATDTVPANPYTWLKLVDQPVGDSVHSLERQPKLDLSLIQRPSEQAETIALSISTTLHPVEILLAQIGQVSDLDLQISRDASATIAGRSTAIEFQSIALSNLLDRLLIPYGLAWQQSEEGIVYVALLEEFDEPGQQDFVFAAADRAFRGFELDYADNPLRNASLLSRAGLAFRAGDFNAAANLYQELENIHPRGEIQAKLFFNLAKVSLLLNRPADAKTLMYQAVDQSLEADLRSSGYCFLSGMHLSDLELENAIKTGRRGVSLAITDSQRRLGALNLARAYLLDRQPESANETLFQNRTAFEGHPLESDTAAVLGAYARLIGSLGPRARQVARNRLLESATVLKNAPLLSFADAYIAGMGLEQIGFRDRAVEMLIRSLAQPDLGQWRRKITYEMAGLQRDSEWIQEAANSYQSLVNSDDIYAIQSLEQLAELYSSNEQHDDCIAICEKLLAKPLTDEQKSSALNLMGMSFKAKGEYYSAAVCFAGMLMDDYQ